jgi:hypothetical protein
MSGREERIYSEREYSSMENRYRNAVSIAGSGRDATERRAKNERAARQRAAAESARLSNVLNAELFHRQRDPLRFFRFRQTMAACVEFDS